MNNKILLPLLAVFGVGTYVYVAGTTESCPACASITQSLGLGSPKEEKAEDDFSCCEVEGDESDDGFSCCSLDEEETSQETAASKAPEKFTPIPAPSWQAKDLDGKTVSSSELEGKVVLVDFWATWCGSCVEMVPNLKAVDAAYREKGLVVVGMSLDDTPKEVKEFVKENDVQYKSLMANEKAIKDFGEFEFIPMAYLIDRQGKIVAMHEGEVSLDQLKAEIEPLL